MTTGGHAQRQPIAGSSRLSLGATLVTLSGIGLVGYGVMFLIRNFTGFIELGLTPEHVGGTASQIRAFSPDLYEYISHLQVAVSGFIIALVRDQKKGALGATDGIPGPGDRGRRGSAPALSLRDRHYRAPRPDLH